MSTGHSPANRPEFQSFGNGNLVTRTNGFFLSGQNARKWHIWDRLGAVRRTKIMCIHAQVSVQQVVQVRYSAILTFSLIDLTVLVVAQEVAFLKARITFALLFLASEFGRWKKTLDSL
jgi:hypothetical protein